MKKFLALCLSVIMILSLTPAVLAENTVPSIPSTGEVYIEAENYTTYKVYESTETTEPVDTTIESSEIIEDSSYHGGKRVHANFYKMYKATVDIPIYVETAGTYFLNFRTILGQVYRVKDATLTIGNTTLLSVPFAPTEPNVETWVTLEVPVTLEQGNNTITYSVSGGYPNLYAYWDYIRISDTRDRTSVSASGTTKIEVEEYPSLMAKNSEGTEYVYGTGNQSETYSQFDSILKVNDPNATAEIWWYKDIYINEDGYYNFEFNTSYHNTYTSTIKGFIDETKLITAAGESSPSNDMTISKSCAYLTKGPHTLKIAAYETTNHATNNRFRADYVSISAWKMALSSESLMIEAEDYPRFYTDTNGSGTYTEVVDSSKIATDNTASGGKFLKISGDIAKAYYELPITAEESGEYVIEARVNKNQEFSLVNGKFTVNDTETLQLASGSAGEMAVFQFSAPLKKGTNTLRFIGETGKSTLYFYIDYIKITKKESIEISAKDTTRVEGESFTATITKSDVVLPYPLLVISDESFSGGKYVTEQRQPGTGHYAAIDIPITVETTGFYDIKSKLMYQFSGTIGLLTYSLLLDGNIVDTYNSEANIEAGVGVWAERTSDVCLTKGSHTITLKTSGYATNIGITLDYIDFISNISSAANPGAITIAKGETVRLEGENYPVYKINPSSTSETDDSVFEADMSGHNKTSGDYTAISFTAEDAGIAGPGIAWVDMNIIIEEEAYYEITYRVQGTESKNYAYMCPRINGVNKDQISGFTKYAIAEYVEHVEIVKLPAGSHSVGVLSKAHPTSSYIAFNCGFDYIEIKPYANPDAVSVPSGETVKLQGEHYRTVTLCNSDSDYGYYHIPEGNVPISNGLIFAYLGSNSTYQNAYMDIPLNVEKAGLYKLTYRIKPSYNSSTPVYLRVGGENVYQTPTDGKSAPGDAANLATFEYSTYLPQGLTSVGVYAGGNSTKYFMYAVDYITVDPLSSAELSLEDTVRIEYESLNTYLPESYSVNESVNAGGGAYLSLNSYENDKGSFTYYVNSPKTGKYELTNVMNFSGSTSGDTIKVYINKDSVPALDNIGGSSFENSYTELSDSVNFSLRDYNATVSLNKGINAITIEITKGDEGLNALDYVEFKPVLENRFTYGNNTVNAKIYYETEKTGTAILAAYDENGRLTALNKNEVENATSTDISAACYGGIPNTIKVFIWDTDKKIVPLAQAENKDISDDVDPTQYLDFVIDIEEGREPVILQLTDPQIIDASQERYEERLGSSAEEYWAKDKMDERCFDYLRETVEATNPDLILMTGDLVYGSFDDDGSAFLALIEVMESFKIPWAPVFGNHENECGLGADWQCEQLENAEHCLFLQRTLTGNGNYNIGITQGGKLKRVFFMLDSNGCSDMGRKTLENGHSKTSNGFGDDQIAWYTQVAENINNVYPGVKYSFAYHIQQEIFRTAYTKYGMVDSNTKNNPINIDTAENKAETDFGYIGRDLKGPWDEDFAVYNGMKSLGTDSIFVGHEHCNSASVVYDGVRFQFGQKSSTYDRANYKKSDGSIVGASSAVGDAIIGGTVMKMSEADGSFTDAYIYYCDTESEDSDEDTTTGGLQLGTDLTLQSTVSASSDTIDGVNAYKFTASSQGKVYVDTSLIANKSTLTFSVYVPETSTGRLSLTPSPEFAIRIKPNELEPEADGKIDGHLCFSTETDIEDIKLTYGEWKTYTVDISVLGSSCTEFAFYIATGNTIYLSNITIS